MTFLIWLYTSKSFAQIRKSFAQLHDSMKSTFRSSGNGAIASSFFVIKGCFANNKAVLLCICCGRYLQKNILNYFKIEG